MNNATEQSMHSAVKKRLRSRHRAEWRFRAYGLCALAVALGALVMLLTSIISKGYTGFLQTQIRLPIVMDASVIDPENTRDADALEHAHYAKLVQRALIQKFPDAALQKDERRLYALLGLSAGIHIKNKVLNDPNIIGTTQEMWLMADSYADMYVKGRINARVPEGERKLSDRQLYWLDTLKKEGRIRTVWNAEFFNRGDSRAAERAGFLGSIVGSLLTVLVCMAIAFPMGVMTAVYLEEFSAKNRWMDILEVNINNLAAVPSIIYGLLGLSVYIGFFGLPRSAPLVGGLTLSLMILPVIIITTRVALKAVPSSVRAAAQGLGASPVQVVWHHTLPLAMPGIMTGTILGIARAIGETAPLLMIGMVAFIVDVPHSIFDPATAMPVQIYLWASNPEMGFVEKTSAGIIVLMTLLMGMNSLAIIIRKRFEVRW